MSVSIGVQGTQNYVVFKHGNKAVEIPCENKEQAEAAAQELTKIESQMVEEEKKLGLTPDQYMMKLQQQAAKASGVGEKMDKVA